MTTLSVKRYIGLVVGLLSVLAMFAGCGKEQAPERKETARPIKTYVVGGDAMARRSFPGRVEASDRVDLSFRVKGPLIELHVRRGQDVAKDFLIARIDPRDYQIALEEAKAAFTKADADFRRYQSLYEKDAVSKAELDQRRSQRDMTKARQDDAESNLSYTYLKAPFTGTISERFVENFEEVSAQQPVVALENFDMLDIIIDVPEGLLSRLQEGQDSIKLTAVFEAASDTPFPVTFKAVSGQADPATRTYQVRLSMEQPKEINVLTGMSAEILAESSAKTVTQADQAVTIPAVAVFQDEGGKSCVWVISEGLTASRREVIVGEVTGTSSIVIQSGLANGDRVATAAISHLREGMTVRLLGN